MEFQLQHPAVRNSTSPLSKTVTRPRPSTQLLRFTFELQIQGWGDEETYSRFEMSSAEEQELQIPSTISRSAAKLSDTWVGWAGVKSRQGLSLLTSESATSSHCTLSRMSWMRWGLHEDHFRTLALRSASADGLLGSGRLPGLSSALHGMAGLNLFQRRALPRRRTSPTLAKTRHISRSAGRGERAGDDGMAVVSGKWARRAR